MEVDVILGLPGWEIVQVHGQAVVVSSRGGSPQSHGAGQRAAGFALTTPRLRPHYFPIPARTGQVTPETRRITATVSETNDGQDRRVIDASDDSDG